MSEKKPEWPSAVPLPNVARATMAVPPPAAGRGNWAGAPSAVFADGVYYLAYRMRRPGGGDRGYVVVVASSADGVDFSTLAVLDKHAFGAESLERPALVRLPDGGWRIYISCATPGSFHWWVDAIDAPDPTAFDPAARVTVLPGDDDTAVKDPVVIFDDGAWVVWACCHPLGDPEATDRMYSSLARSDDGVTWRFDGASLRGTPGAWDARGARLASLIPRAGKWLAFYDGRRGAADNGEERTGIATGSAVDDLRPAMDGPAAASPWASGSLRYVSALPLEGDRCRLYFEASVPDGSHGLFTQLVDLLHS